jgi:hypothetical protein
MQKGAVGVLAVSKSFMKENQPAPSTLGNMYMKKKVQDLVQAMQFLFCQFHTKQQHLY